MNFLKEGRERLNEYSEKSKAKVNKFDNRLGNVKKGKLTASEEDASMPVVARPLNALKDPKSFPPPPIHRVAHGEINGAVPPAPAQTQPVQAPVQAQPAQYAQPQAPQVQYGQPQYAQPGQPQQVQYAPPSQQQQVQYAPPSQQQQQQPEYGYPAQAPAVPETVSPPGYSPMPPTRAPISSPEPSPGVSAGVPAPTGHNRPPPPPPARQSPAPSVAPAQSTPIQGTSVLQQGPPAQAAADEYEEKPKKIMFPLVDPSSFPAPPKFVAKPVEEEPPKRSYGRHKDQQKPSAQATDASEGPSEHEPVRASPSITDPRSFAPPPVYGGSSNRDQSSQPSPTYQKQGANINTDPAPVPTPPRPLPPRLASNVSNASVPPPQPARPTPETISEPNSELEHVTQTLRKTSIGGAPNFAAEIAARKPSYAPNSAANAPKSVASSESLATTKSDNSDFSAILAKKKRPPVPPKKKPGLASVAPSRSVDVQNNAGSDKETPPPMAPRPQAQPHAQPQPLPSPTKPPVPAPRVSPKPSSGAKSVVSPEEHPPPMAPRPPPVNHSTRPNLASPTSSEPSVQSNLDSNSDFNFELASQWYAAPSGKLKLPKCFDGMPYTYTTSTTGAESELKVAIRNPKDLSVIRAQITWANHNPGSTVQLKRYDIPAPRLPTKEQLEQYSETFGDNIAHWCENKIGMQVGNGECWTLAKDAIERGTGGRAMAPVGYNFGIIVLQLGGPVALAQKDSVRRGDIVQFTSVKTAGPRGTKTYGAPNHTAVVVKVNSPTNFDIVHQNIGGVRRVSPGNLDLSEFVQGEIQVYRVAPEEWAGELKA